MTTLNNDVPAWMEGVAVLGGVGLLLFGVLAALIAKCGKAIIILSTRITEDTAMKFSSLEKLVESRFREQSKQQEKTLGDFQKRVIDGISDDRDGLQKSHEMVVAQIKLVGEALILLGRKTDAADLNIKNSVERLRQHEDRLSEIESRQERILVATEKMFADSAGVLSLHAGLFEKIAPTVNEMRQHEALFVGLVEKVLQGNSMALDRSEGMWQKSGEILETNRGIAKLLEVLMLDSLISATAQTLKVEIPLEPKLSMPEKQDTKGKSQSKCKRNAQADTITSAVRKMTKGLERITKTQPTAVGRTFVAKPKKKRAR